jgi:hypothetical protein
MVGRVLLKEIGGWIEGQIAEKKHHSAGGGNSGGGERQEKIAEIGLWHGQFFSLFIRRSILLLCRHVAEIAICNRKGGN